MPLCALEHNNVMYKQILVFQAASCCDQIFKEFTLFNLQIENTQKMKALIHVSGMRWS